MSKDAHDYANAAALARGRLYASAHKAADLRDPYTAGRKRRVAQIAVSIEPASGLSAAKKAPGHKLPKGRKPPIIGEEEGIGAEKIEDFFAATA